MIHKDMLLFIYMNILKTGKETSFHGTWQESDATDWKHTQGIVKRNTLELNIWIISMPLEYVYNAECTQLL